VQKEKIKVKQSSTQEEFEDTEGVIRNHESKGRQCNVQKERDKGKQSSTQEEVEYTKGVIRNRKSKGRHSFSLFVCLVVFDATFKYL
jgi:hypothetical protein